MKIYVFALLVVTAVVIAFPVKNNEIPIPDEDRVEFGVGAPHEKKSWKMVFLKVVKLDGEDDCNNSPDVSITIHCNNKCINDQHSNFTGGQCVKQHGGACMCYVLRYI